MKCSEQGLALSKHEISSSQPRLTTRLMYVLFKMTGARGFSGQKPLCMRLYWRIHSMIPRPDPTDGATPTGNPGVNQGLPVIVVCQRRLTDYNKCPTLVGDIDSGGASIVGGEGTRGLCANCPFCSRLLRT